MLILWKFLFISKSFVRRIYWSNKRKSTFNKINWQFVFWNLNAIFRLFIKLFFIGSNPFRKQFFSLNFSEISLDLSTTVYAFFLILNMEKPSDNYNKFKEADFGEESSWIVN